MPQGSFYPHLEDRPASPFDLSPLPISVCTFHLGFSLGRSGRLALTQEGASAPSRPPLAASAGLPTRRFVLPEPQHGRGVDWVVLTFHRNQMRAAVKCRKPRYLVSSFSNRENIRR